MARQQRQFPQGKYILRSQNKSQNYAVYLYYYWKGKQVRHSVDLYVECLCTKGLQPIGGSVAVF